jgi:DNA-binding SARP family transcriptional activator
VAGELLEARQYQRVAELLHEARVASEKADDVILADILATAHRICLALAAYQAEVEWHRQAHEEAGARERELKQQLRAILNLVSGPQAPEPRELPPTVPKTEVSSSERSPPEPEEHLGLWQRIQALLGRGPPIKPPEREAPVVSAGAVVAPLVVKEEQRRLPSLVIYCLGPFRVYQNDQLITDWAGLKGQCILKYLVAHRGRPIAKDILMDVFWRDADPEAARRNLHQAIYCLRQTLRLGQPNFQHIQFGNDCYLLNPEMDTWIDFEEFEKRIQAGRRLEAAGQLAEAVAEYGIAEGLYQGDFLEEDLYEDWPRLQREHIRNMYLDIANCLSGYYVQQGEYTPAIALCQKVLAQDNCHEETHRRLMQCYLAQGQRHLAVRQYQTCVEALKEELDLTPSKETVALYQRIIITA